MRMLTSLAAAKSVRSLIRIFGGGATAAPGLAAEIIDPKSLAKLSKLFSNTILVTGTNGKTTTSRLLGNILQEAKISFLHNRSGSNLRRGIIGTITEEIGLLPKLSKKLALFEVDEAVLSTIASETNPKLIIFNNLFRDQLDRYGEVDKLRKLWQKTLEHLPAATVVVLNSDDHSVAHLGTKTRAKIIYFGIEDQKLSLSKLPHASDFTSCISCGKDLLFDAVYLAHLGRYRCPTCGLSRPKPNVYAQEIYLDATEGFRAKIQTPKGELTLKIPLPGLYNVYNSLAAIAAGLVLGVDLRTIQTALEKSKAAFGRTEQLEVEGKKLFIALVKNPAGFNEILRTIFRSGEEKLVLIAINDALADGQDVSWLWDVDFEVLAGKVRRVIASGTRAHDLALRLKYTGAGLEVDIEENLEEALDRALGRLPFGETLYLLPTYTAMLRLKKILASRGVGGQFWED